MQGILDNTELEEAKRLKKNKVKNEVVPVLDRLSTTTTRHKGE
jgi:hypothetical protein